MRWFISAAFLVFMVLIMGYWGDNVESTARGSEGMFTLGSRGDDVYSPGHHETSEYMIGEVAVSVILVESNGSHETETEEWNSTEEINVRNEITDGLRWWIDRAEENDITLDLTIDFIIVETGYEPINHKSLTSQQGEGMWLWMDEVLNSLGYSVSGYEGISDYANDFRDVKETDWVYVIFVVDSSEDPDGKFDDDGFAFGSHGGPFIVMTYDNSYLGIENMEVVTAHETGHIFFALDQYSGESSPTERSGYLDIENQNHEDGGSTDEECIMRSTIDSYTNGSVSNITREMIGWRNLDKDGIPDILDTIPSVSLEDTKPEYNTPGPSFHGTARVNPYPNSNPHGSGRDVTINTISMVQYRINSGGWWNATPVDGEFDQEKEGFDFTISEPVPNGNHTLIIRTRNSAGNFNETIYHFAINVTHPPEVIVIYPNSGVHYGEVAINWSASDFDGNITDILIQYVCKGVTVSITDWIPNIPPFLWNISILEDGDYIIRVFARDNSSAIGFNDSLEFHIDNPDAPELNMVDPVGGVLDEVVDIRWTARDPDGDNITFYIHLSRDGITPNITLISGLDSKDALVSGNSYHFVWDTLNSPPDNHRIPDGEYYLMIRAEDSSSSCLDTTLVSQVFELNNNDPPEVYFNLSARQVNEDESITFTSISSDPEGDVLLYTWEFGDGVEITITYPVINHIFTSNGTHIVLLTVSDGAFYNSTEHIIVVRNLPPVAHAGENLTLEENEPFTLSASLSYDTSSDMDSLQYIWEINGIIYKGRDIHLSLSSGTYLANLTVRDDDGAEDRDLIRVSVANYAPVADAGEFQIANVDEVMFFDASGTTDSPSDMAGLLYSWDLGDGNVICGISPSHSYSHPGAYLVTLTVTDDEGAYDTDTMIVHINGVPVRARIDPMDGVHAIGDRIHFSAFQTTCPDNISLQYIWDFGDGSLGYGIEVIHSYGNSEEYTVKLNVQDNDSFEETEFPYIDSIIIRINSPPHPVVKGDKTPTVNKAVEFDASESYDVDGYITKYAWDFGDGQVEVYVDNPLDPAYPKRTGGLYQGNRVRHTYTRSERFTMKLTVFDNNGGHAVQLLELDVEEKPEDLMDILNSIYQDPSLDNEYFVFTIIVLVVVFLLTMRGISRKKRKSNS